MCTVNCLTDAGHYDYVEQVGKGCSLRQSSEWFLVSHCICSVGAEPEAGNAAADGADATDEGAGEGAEEEAREHDAVVEVAPEDASKAEDIE